MADACEVLSSFYDCFARLSQAGRERMDASQTPIGRMLSLGLSEEVRCLSPACGVVSHLLKYSSFFHLVNAAALRTAEPLVGASPATAAGGGASPFERRLAALLGGDTKGCDKDPPFRGCGAATPITHQLKALGRVFTISLAWNTATAPEKEVMETMSALEVMVRPGRIFAPQAGLVDGRQGESAFELRAMVCYYGAHFLSFTRTDEPDESGAAKPLWTRFDDATVSEVGDWAALCRSCARGHLQPTVLFYEELE